MFGGSVGKFAFNGGMQVKSSWEENTVTYRHYQAKDLGGLIHHPEQARRIIDSSVTPQHLCRTHGPANPKGRSPTGGRPFGVGYIGGQTPMHTMIGSPSSSLHNTE